MNKSFLFLIPLLFITGCMSIRWITVNKGVVIEQNGKPVNIVGNPQMTCIDNNGNIVAEGVFVYERDDGAFIVSGGYDTEYKIVENPHCKLGLNENEMGN